MGEGCADTSRRKLKKSVWVENSLSLTLVFIESSPAKYCMKKVASMEEKKNKKTSKMGFHDDANR
jgi:hypothetical protein